MNCSSTSHTITILAGLTMIVIVVGNCCESCTYAWGRLDRSGRVLVGHERSDRVTVVLIMFKTNVVLR